MQDEDLATLSELIEKQERQIRLVIGAALIPVLLLFAFTFFVFYRRKREADFRERELELKVSKAEMEMKALRAQVNPHFIFNCLSSIQHFIHHNNSELAEQYLVKFSRLIRQVLEHSVHKFISLNDDLQTLQSYVELEQLRMRGKFTFEVQIGENVDSDRIFIPPMLFQPLIENAIWHGVSNRQSGGEISISFTKDDEKLISTIKDNGQVAQPKSSHNGKSFGLSIIKDRLKLIGDTENEQEMEFSSIFDSGKNYAGRQVRLVIPYEEE